MSESDLYFLFEGCNNFCGICFFWSSPVKMTSLVCIFRTGICLGWYFSLVMTDEIII